MQGSIRARPSPPSRRAPGLPADSNGNICTAGAGHGGRLQKFTLQ